MQKMKKKMIGTQHIKKMYNKKPQQHKKSAHSHIHAHHICGEKNVAVKQKKRVHTKI